MDEPISERAMMGSTGCVAAMPAARVEQLPAKWKADWRRCWDRRDGGALPDAMTCAVQLEEALRRAADRDPLERALELLSMGETAVWGGPSGYRTRFTLGNMEYVTCDDSKVVAIGRALLVIGQYAIDGRIVNTDSADEIARLRALVTENGEQATRLTRDGNLARAEVARLKLEVEKLTQYPTQAQRSAAIEEAYLILNVAWDGVRDALKDKVASALNELGKVRDELATRYTSPPTTQHVTTAQVHSDGTCSYVKRREPKQDQSELDDNALVHATAALMRVLQEPMHIHHAGELASAAVIEYLSHASKP